MLLVHIYFSKRDQLLGAAAISSRVPLPDPPAVVVPLRLPLDLVHRPLTTRLIAAEF
jgi:hypothetical protein